MAGNTQDSRRDRRGTDGQWHRPCLRARRLRRDAQRRLAGPHQGRAGDHQRQHGPQVSKKTDHRGRRASQGARAASSRPKSLTQLADCDLVIETATEKEDVKRKIFTERLPGAEARGDPRHQHVVDLDHAAGRLDRPAGALHRHSLHESGAADGAGRAHPRHRHRRHRPSKPPSNSSASSARRSRWRRISRPSSSTASCCR